MKASKIRACIIGGGAAGLCAARHLSQLESMFVFDVFEQTDRIGGTWNYTDMTGVDSNGLPIHSSMYKNMRTNIPLELMEFQDFPSKSELSFVHHSEILKYLHQYALHFDIIKYIKFEHQIILISRTNQFWTVKALDLKTNNIFETIYDTIFLCNGRYAKPNIPDSEQIKGIDSFNGQLIHSHNYREPQVFQNQTVLVLGAGPSGIDISIEISQFAKQVFLCHQLDEPIKNLSNINIKQILTKIKQIIESKVVFQSENQIENVDAIIFATGYKYDFTFLDNNCGINVNNYGRVEGLYLHLINTTHPSMAIWGIMNNVLPFQIYHQQVLFFIKCLTKEVILPTKTQMENEERNDFEYRKSLGMSERHAHKMVGKLFQQYSDRLVQLSDIKALKPVVKKLHNDLREIRKNDIINYKNMIFKLISDENYVIKQ